MKLSVEPLEAGKGREVENLIKGGSIPKEFIPGVEKGVESVSDSGILAGFPIIDYKVKILDATWHMPNSNRNALGEYKQNHIKSSIFFDLDENSNQNIPLPHMLPVSQDWEKIVSRLGIKNDYHIIIYDNSEVLSASRCWFTFLYFGHDINLVSVLDLSLIHI